MKPKTRKPLPTAKTYEAALTLVANTFFQVGAAVLQRDFGLTEEQAAAWIKTVADEAAPAVQDKSDKLKELANGI